MLSDYTNLEVENCHKLSSTAAFKTLTSSPHKPLTIESPETERRIRNEEAKTVKRTQRLKNAQAKLPKLSTLEPQAEEHHSLFRKTTRAHLAVFDEGQAEPFEIIESIDFQNHMKWKSPKEFSRNTPKQREKVNEEHEHENTEIRIQTSSFVDSDSFYPALSEHQQQPKTTKQSSRKYIGDFGT